MNALVGEHPYKAGSIDVEVWWGSVSSDASIAAAGAPAADIKRSRYYSDRERRAQFLIGRAIVRARLARLTGWDPSIIPLHTTCSRCGLDHGKPVSLEWLPHFSISHSGDAVAVAFHASDRVGLDVECEDRSPFLNGLSDEILSDPEADPAGTPLDDDQLLRLWVRKEAVLKCTADGLEANMRDVVTEAASDGFAAEFSGKRFGGAEGVHGNSRFAVAAPGVERPRITHLRAFRRSDRRAHTPPPHPVDSFVESG